MSDEWNNSNSAVKIVKNKQYYFFLKQIIYVIKSKCFNSEKTSLKNKPP